MHPSNAELHAFARQVASHLPEWDYDEDDSTDADGKPCWSAMLRAIGSEARIAISLQVKAGKARVHAHSWSPAVLTDGNKRFNLPYNYERASRTFAWGREPARVAGEIRAHVMPCARRIAELYREACEQHEAMMFKHELAVQVLRPVVGQLHRWQQTDPRSSFDVDAGDCKLRGNVRYGEIDLEIRGINAGQVARLIELLRGQERTERAS